MKRRAFLMQSGGWLAAGAWARGAAGGAGGKPLSAAILGHTGRGNFGHALEMVPDQVLVEGLEGPRCVRRGLDGAGRDGEHVVEPGAGLRLQDRSGRRAAGVADEDGQGHGASRTTAFAQAP